MEGTVFSLMPIVVSVAGPGRLRWKGVTLPGASLHPQDTGRAGGCTRVHWGRTLLVTIFLLIVWGELGPAASVVVR